MKRVKVIVIILLLLLLYFQMYYYNKEKTNAKSKNQTNETNIVDVNEIIEKNNDSYMVFDKYTLCISQKEFDNRIRQFAEKHLKKIYEEIGNKLQDDYIKQYYDLNTASMNSMYIYSAEDLINIAYLSGIPHFKNSPDYYGMDVDPKSIVDIGEYVSFNGLINYSNGKEVEININVAKDNKTKPFIKISGVSE